MEIIRVTLGLSKKTKTRSAEQFYHKEINQNVGPFRVHESISFSGVYFVAKRFPIPSMYDIFTYIGLIFMINVGR